MSLQRCLELVDLCERGVLLLVRVSKGIFRGCCVRVLKISHPEHLLELFSSCSSDDQFFGDFVLSSVR